MPETPSSEASSPHHPENLFSSPPPDNDVSQRLLRVSLRRLWRYVSHLFHLKEDADEESTVNDIKRSIEFRGANLWALIFAVLLASVGLNVNSTAVIIGAMLISPLMGPIMGIGLALGTNDIDLYKRSLRNLLVAVVISVLASTFYFLITPLHEAQSELLARTRPTIFDVLIAVFGGSIGIIASSRKEKTNAIPGVAIATALMPPLCTAGYGLATAQWAYFFGAFYLFFINSVFICLSTLVVVRYLKFQKVSFVDPEREKKVRVYIALFAFFTILPSIYVAWEVVQETFFKSRAQQFIAQNFDFPDTQIIKTELDFHRQGSEIRLTLIGEPISPEDQQQLLRRLPQYQLFNTELKLAQPNKGSADFEKEFSALNQQLRVGIVEDLYKKNAELLQQKEAELLKKNNQLKALEQELLQLKTDAFPVAQVSAELETQFNGIESLSIEQVRRVRKGELEEIPIALVKWQRAASLADKNRLQKFLRVRLEEPKLEVLNY